MHQVCVTGLNIAWPASLGSAGLTLALKFVLQDGSRASKFTATTSLVLQGGKLSSDRITLGLTEANGLERAHSIRLDIMLGSEVSFRVS